MTDIHSPNFLLCRKETVAQFAALYERKRLKLGWSHGDVAAAAIMSQSELVRLVRHHEPIGMRPVFKLCAVMGIINGDAWAVAISGRLPKAVTVEEAKSVLDAIRYQAPVIDVKRGLERVRRSLYCELCSHRWKTKRAIDPKICPNCESRHWKEGMTERQLETRRRRSHGVKLAIQRRKAAA